MNETPIPNTKQRAKNIRKTLFQCGGASVLLCLVCGALIFAGGRLASLLFDRPRTVWVNDVARAAREKARLDRPDVIQFNSSPDIVFLIDGKGYEAGLRSDGVVVWRARKK